ncbi:MAG: hypothetical protein ABJH68_10805, partial [Ilumatobacter sp.]
GSDDADATVPEITLITSTTEAPVFDEGDGVVEPPTTDGTEDSGPTAPTSDVDTTVATPPSTAAPTTLGSVPDPVTSAPEPSAPAPTDPAPASVGGDFVLGPDGLGAVPFGTEPEQTITFLTSVLGAPTADTGWVDPFEIGACSGTRIRRVDWNQLQLEFGDASDVVQGRDHFYAYFYGREGSATAEPAGLQTAEEIGVGSSVASLLAAYPGITLFQGDDLIGPSFNVNDNLTGRMSGTADDDVVEVVVGGLPCDG